MSNTVRRAFAVALFLFLLAPFSLAATSYSVGSIRDVRPGALGFISVKQFGATGDGTTDDTTAVQAAIDFAGASDTISFPRGSYVMGEVLVDKSLTIRGYGATILPTNTILAGLSIDAASTTLTSATPVFVTGHVDDGGSEGRSIEIAGAGTAGGMLKAFIETYTSSTEVEISIPAVTTVAGAAGTLGTRSGFQLDNTASFDGLVVEGLRWEGDGTTTRAMSGCVWNFSGATVRNSTFRNMQFVDLPFGLQANATSSGRFDNVAFENLRFEDMIGTESGQGLGLALLGGYTEPLRASVNNCTFIRCRRHGLYVSNGMTVSVTGNHFYQHRLGETITDTPAAALAIARCYNVTAGNNTFEENSDVSVIVTTDYLAKAVWADVQPQGVILSNNVYRDNLRSEVYVGTDTPDAPNPDPVHLGDTNGLFNRVVVSDNVIDVPAARTYSSIVVRSGRQVTVARNQITAIGRTLAYTAIGIYNYGILNLSDDYRINDNEIHLESSDTTRGIGLDATTYATVYSSLSDAFPSTDLSGGTDNTFQIAVGGDAAETVTLDESACTTGALTAAEMQTKIQALGGNKTAVTVSYSAYRYTIRRVVTDSAESWDVVITDGVANNAADDLKIGIANGGTETSTAPDVSIKRNLIYADVGINLAGTATNPNLDYDEGIAAGTQHKVVKYTSDGKALGPSNITDTTGTVVISSAGSSLTVDSTAVDGAAGFYLNNDAFKFGIYVDDDGGTGNKLYWRDVTSSATRGAITTDGKFGWGTTAPATKFEVGGTGAGLTVHNTDANGAAPLILQNDAQAYSIYPEGGDADKLYIRDVTGAATRGVITTAGDLGWKTTDPKSNFENNGTSGAKIYSSAISFSASAQPATTYLVSGTSTVTLDAVAGVANRGYRVKNTGAAVVTIAVQTGESLEGVTNGTLALAATESAFVACDGSGWWITERSYAPASTSHAGILSDTDWDTFNDKQPAGSYLTSESDTLATVVGRGDSAGATITTRTIQPEADSTYYVGLDATRFSAGYFDSLFAASFYANQGSDAPSWSAGTADPSAGAGVTAKPGSLYSRNNAGTGELWLKTGATDTSWSKIL